MTAAPLTDSSLLLVRAEELHREALAEVARMARRLDALEQAMLAGGADRPIGSHEIAARLGIKYLTFMDWMRTPAIRSRFLAAGVVYKQNGLWYSTPRRIARHLESVGQSALGRPGSRRRAVHPARPATHPAPAAGSDGAGPA